MKYNLLGSTGLKVSELCLGTMTFGGRGMWTAIGTLPQEAVNALVNAIAKKRYKIEQSFYTFSQTLVLTLFEKIPINEIFNKYVNERIFEEYPMLFNINNF